MKPLPVAMFFAHLSLNKSLLPAKSLEKPNAWHGSDFKKKKQAMALLPR